MALLREPPCALQANANPTTANPTTGGLLIEYNPEKLDPDAARQVLEMINPEALDWFEAVKQAEPAQPDEAPESGAGSRLAPAPAANREALEYLGMPQPTRSAPARPFYGSRVCIYTAEFTWPV